MVIVIVRWYIKKEKESEEKFKATWIGMEPKSKDGLFREFFSTPTDEVDAKYHSLDFENIHYSTYINVGVWRELSDFNEAIGLMIPGRKKNEAKPNEEIISVFDFEFKLRERIVMDVKKTRGGTWTIPQADF